MVRELLSMRLVLALVLAFGQLALAAPSALRCFPVRGEAVSVQPITSTQPNVPGAIGDALGVWTGSNLLVWGTPIESMKRSEPADDFFSFDPGTDTWKAFHLKGLPRLRRPTLVWASGRAVLWGGVKAAESRVTNEGAIFDPSAGTWQPTASVGAPLARQYHSATAVGGQMLVFGGGGGGGVNGMSCDGALLDPIANRWSALAPAPAEVCAALPEVRLAGGRDRVVMLLPQQEQRSKMRAAIYDVAKRRWTVGPIFDPGRTMSYEGAPEFGPDGAAYVLGYENYPDRGALLLRIAPDDAHLDAIGSVPEAGTLVRSGNALHVVGAGLVTEIDLASNRCTVPMRASGFLNPRARQLLVGTDDGFVVWGHGIGSTVRFGSGASSAEPGSNRNVHGAAVQDARGHCGGATPPPWSPGPAESPVRDFALLIRKGTRNTNPHVVADVKTDADGLFEARLGRGQYCVIEAAKRAVTLKLPKKTDAESRRCLEEENARCLATFEVASDGAAVPLVIHVPNRCFSPCYRGPPPP